MLRHIYSHSLILPPDLTQPDYFSADLFLTIQDCHDYQNLLWNPASNPHLTFRFEGLLQSSWVGWTAISQSPYHEENQIMLWQQRIKGQDGNNNTAAAGTFSCNTNPWIHGSRRLTTHPEESPILSLIMDAWWQLLSHNTTGGDGERPPRTQHLFIQRPIHCKRETNTLHRDIWRHACAAPI